jgi:hypothetical protein
VGTVRVKTPGADIGATVGGLVPLLAALAENYQVVTGDEAAQVLLSAEDVIEHHKYNCERASAAKDLTPLQRRYGVTDAEVAAVHDDHRSAPPPDGDSTMGYAASVAEKIQRSHSWMDPGPGKHVEACRSPSFSITVGARRAVATAVAIILKVAARGKTTTAGEVVWQNGLPDTRTLADCAKAFYVIADSLVTMDNMILPPKFGDPGVLIIFETIESTRAEGNPTLRNAVPSWQWGLVAGYLFIFVMPGAMAVEPFSNALSALARNSSGRTVSRYETLTEAALHIGLSTAYIFAGDLRK